MNKPLIDNKYILKKIPGKGGWTYAEIPEVVSDKNNPFGWVQVKGHIDDYHFEHYKIMPMGNGNLFFPVKAQIRRKLGKKEGDEVHIVLYADKSPYKVPEEIMECILMDDPVIERNFKEFTDGEKKEYIDWVYSAKTEDTKERRILKMLENIRDNIKFRGQ